MISEINEQIQDIIATKEFEHKQTILELKRIEQYINKKSNFSEVWFYLLKHNIKDDKFYFNLLCYYFNLEESQIITKNISSYCFDFQDVIIEIPYKSNIVSVNCDYKCDGSFIVRVQLDNNISVLLQREPEFVKDSKYTFVEQYIKLLEENAPLSKRLKLRFPEEKVFNRYFFYYTKGYRNDKKYKRDLEYYRKYLKNYNDFYEERVVNYKIGLNKGKEKWKKFKNELLPLLDYYFDERFCQISYNIDIRLLLNREEE